ncbi:imidazolonepropionase [Oleiharenicola lentus]|uniref:imidazolonepropionase n=1 Tax=Oleiharenicola lentus TaxID=2508720 RepID=UPI003F66F92E
MTLLIRNARLLTLAQGARPRRGKEMSELSIIPVGDVLVTEGKIAAFGAKVTAPPDTETIDAQGRVVMPGFVDCHTHACWAGERMSEWLLQLSGTPYSEILKKGGGIHATVNAVREATQKQLAANLRDRLALMLREGTTTVEVKSGYGLTTEAELKMLRAIRRAASEWPGTVVATALLGHAFEGDLDTYARMVVKEMLAEVSREFPDIAIDAYCEDGAWSVEACVKLFEKAGKHHPLRVHADQFTSLGMIPEAIRLGVRSIDHLEAARKNDLLALAASRVIGVMLPCTGFQVDGRYARAGFLAEQGGAVALATNCNPGSSPSHSMPLAIALAVRFCGLTPAEAIAAATVNAAAVLGLNDRGTLAVGQRADLILLRHKDERALTYELGGNPVDLVVCGGQLVR